LHRKTKKLLKRASIAYPKRQDFFYFTSKQLPKDVYINLIFNRLIFY